MTDLFMPGSPARNYDSAKRIGISAWNTWFYPMS
jgi:hypothetical protein